MEGFALRKGGGGCREKPLKFGPSAHPIPFAGKRPLAWTRHSSIYISQINYRLEGWRITLSWPMT